MLAGGGDASWFGSIRGGSTIVVEAVGGKQKPEPLWMKATLRKMEADGSILLLD